MPTSNPIQSYSVQQVYDAMLRPARMLIVGQSNAIGVAGLHQNLQFSTEESIDTIFGAKSHISFAIKAALFEIKSQPILPIIDAWAINDDGANTSRVQDITVTGTATEAGTIKGYAISKGGNQQVSIDVSVAVGDASTVVATAINAALSALSSFPYTTTVLASVVTCTSVHKGVIGNELDFHFDSTTFPAGITLAVSQTTAGAGVPTLPAGIVSEMILRRYLAIVAPYEYNVTTIRTQLKAFTDDLYYNECFDGTLYQGLKCASTDFTTIFNASKGLDGLNVRIHPLKKVTSTYGEYTGGIFTPVLAHTTRIATVELLKQINGSTIANYMSNGEAFGKERIITISAANTKYSVDTFSEVLESDNWSPPEISMLRTYQLNGVERKKDSTRQLVWLGQYTMSTQAELNQIEFRNSAYLAREVMSARDAGYFAQINYVEGGILPDLINSHTNSDLSKSHIQNGILILTGERSSVPIGDADEKYVADNRFAGVMQNDSLLVDASFKEIDKSFAFSRSLGQVSYIFLFRGSFPIRMVTAIQKNV